MIKLIAEIGINFEGSTHVGKKLIADAAAAGAWGVKFQYRNVSTFYKTANEIGDSIVLSELQKNEMNKENLKEFCLEAKKNNLKLGMSFFRKLDLDEYIERFGVPDFIKIPSAECLNKELVDSALSFGVEVIISTGGQEINKIIDLYKHHSKIDQLTVLHCIANYPSALGTQNLSKIQLLKDYFCAGYSSHDEDYEVCYIAMALGAEVIERHITVNKNGPGLDDSSSSDKEEFKRLGLFCQNFNEVLGSKYSKPNQGELLNLQNLGTGLYATRNIKRGEKVDITTLELKAPRRGLSPADFLETFAETKLEQNLLVGEPLSSFHFEKKLILDQKANQFISDKLLSIPVRLHDFKFFNKLFPTAAYEFHLSYKEILESDIESLVPTFPSHSRYSIHLPDYIPGNRILDPISSDPDVTELSWKIIDKACKFSEALERLSKYKVPIVGSFSQLSGRSNEDFFKTLKSVVLDSRGILPQWLPHKAWYFGGCAKLDAFCSQEYVDLIKNTETQICLDLCHLILSANSARANYSEWLKDLLPHAGHLHLADASGEDSEGLMFGQGLLGDYSLLLSEPNLKVIEVWQAHLNAGSGFIKSINKLMELSENE